MNFCRIFIDRPVATTLMSLAIFAAGIICYPLLPVATMPDMASTAIMVVASQPGADPEQMATSVVGPLEHRLAGLADLENIESTTSQGSSSLFLNFASSRSPDGALRDVRAALRAARADLPQGTLDGDPEAFKLDGGGFPVYLMSLTSDTLSQGQLYDIAHINVDPVLSEVQGVGRVEVVGSSSPAVRVELNPGPLYRWGIGLEDIRSALASANAFTPKGFIDSRGQRMTLTTNDQALKAEDYRNLIIAYRSNFFPVRLSDVATVKDDVQDVYQTAYLNGQRAVTLVVTAQPHANTVAIVNGINERMGQLRASLPAQAQLHVGLDTSRSIRAALLDAKETLFISVILVVLVIFLFFRKVKATIIPAVTVPVALSGTLAVMAMFNFSLDVLSLMALTIAVGFVVDDAIVVLENIARHIENGETRYEASIRGSSEIGFTVLSISASLIAVFIPLLFLPGSAGSIMFEFCMTMIAAIVISMWLSLTLTPMMCARMLEVDHGDESAPRGVMGAVLTKVTWVLDGMATLYARSMQWCLRHTVLVGLTLPLSFVLLVFMVTILPKDFVPQQDISLLGGNLEGDPTMSFQEMDRRVKMVADIIRKDPDVVSTTVFTNSKNTADFYVHLKDKGERAPVEDVLTRIRKVLPQEPGAEIMFWNQGGGNQGGNSQNNTGNYRYVLRGENVEDMSAYIPKLMAYLRDSGHFTNLSSPTEHQSVSAVVAVRRETEARYGVTPQLIQQALYDSYGQSIVSTIHLPMTTHRVVMVLSPQYREDPYQLHSLWVSTSAGTAAGGIASNLIRVRESGGAESAFNTRAAASIQNALANRLSGTSSAGSAVSSSIETMVPLDNVAEVKMKPQPLMIEHRDGYFSESFSFDLKPGFAYSEATKFIEQALRETHAPSGVMGEFTGTAGDTSKMLVNGLLAFAAALAVMYIVLGILYESLIHPITILSTLPSAGIGAVLALWVAGNSFNLIAMIGIILLTGIVKKNAILVIDFAIEAERKDGLSPRDAVYKASVTRFRPIIMTSLAAALGAVPLIIGHGYGAEMRAPLGISVLGGMIVSQLLTLYTTPIVYLWMDKVGRWGSRLVRRLVGASKVSSMISASGERV